jgi:hypothetical protein
MNLPPPLLAQLSEPSRQIPPLPDFTVGPDGLLRRTGSETPLVEELLARTSEIGAEASAALETIITRTYPDNPDPLIRDRRRLDPTDSTLWLSTIMTKAGDDRPDPYFVSTIMTALETDHPDPGRARRGL